ASLFLYGVVERVGEASGDDFVDNVNVGILVFVGEQSRGVFSDICGVDILECRVSGDSARYWAGDGAPCREPSRDSDADVVGVGVRAGDSSLDAGICGVGVLTGEASDSNSSSDGIGDDAPVDELSCIAYADIVGVGVRAVGIY
ncbi:hypothetical protein ACJJTC_019582, partial [Scirpophaga incertulas]